MNRLNVSPTSLLFFLIILITFGAGQNRVSLSPSPGIITSSSDYTLSITSDIPADSVAFSIEYRSGSGMLRKKSVGVVTIPPFRINLKTDELHNQYFFGANAIAKIYRKDDTVQIVNSPRLFFLPDPIPDIFFPLYPEEYENNTPIPFYQDSLSHVDFFRNNNNLLIHFSLSNQEKRSNIPNDDGITVILDPLLSRLPYPGNSTVILFIPLSGDAQLITSAEKGSEESFSISRTGTKIDIKKDFFLTDSSFNGEITIPDFILGGTLPESLGVNLIIPQTGKNGADFISLIPGEDFIQHTPLLFPIFVKTDIPAEPVNPLPSFGISFLISFTIMGIIVLLHHAPAVSRENITGTEDDITSLIEKDIISPELTVSYLAQKLEKSEHQINREMLRLTGKRTSAYIRWARIEIVKERLVSSNASEISIAKECGFKTIAEMENAFLYLIGIAPYQFREKYGLK